MPQSFCAYSSVPDPYEVLLGASGQIVVHLLADDHLTWQDGTTQTVSAVGGTGLGTLATSAYGGFSVDNQADVYYVLMLKNQPIPTLVKEKDIATADSVLGGTPTWAKRLRIEGGILYPCPQP